MTNSKTEILRFRTKLVAMPKKCEISVFLCHDSGWETEIFIYYFLLTKFAVYGIIITGFCD